MVKTFIFEKIKILIANNVQESNLHKLIKYFLHTGNKFKFILFSSIYFSMMCNSWVSTVGYSKRTILELKNMRKKAKTVV